MRLVAVLSWWQEDPAWLMDTVRSLALAHVDALVAVDGSYPHHPGATARSEPEQGAAIMAAAQQADIGCTLFRPPALWASECEKRSVAFEMAEHWMPDWLLVIDSDEVILTAPTDLKARLEASDRDCAEVASLEQPSTVHGAEVEGASMPQIAMSRWVKPRRCLFRAIPGLRVGDAHYDYLTPDGRNLWGDGDEPALSIRDMVVDHRKGRRDPGRLAASQAYYTARDEAGVERHRVNTPAASAGKVAETNAMLAEALRNGR